MSEERTPDAIWRFRVAGRDGKKTIKIELFIAAQWRYSWNPFKRNMTPRPKHRDNGYWKRYYRLRINGKWHGRTVRKFTFYTLPEALGIAERLVKKFNG